MTPSTAPRTAPTGSASRREVRPVFILMVLLGLGCRWVPHDGVWNGAAMDVVAVSLSEGQEAPA